MNQRVLIYVAIGLAIFILLVITFFPGAIYVLRDSTSSNSNLDKCKPSPGYTEESWREHMGHHPNIYRECLE